MRAGNDRKSGRKAGALLLALVLAAVSLTGCSGRQEESSQPVSSSGTSGVEASSQADTAADTYDYSAGLTETGYFEGIEAQKFVTLPDYKSMEIPEDISTVSDEELQSELDNRMSSYATTEQVTDRAVEDGDTVNIDYVGSVDGVEFAGGNTGGAGTTVTIGVTSYIDDFLEQLIGHTPGETFDVNVTFPDPYENNTDLSGKDAVFVTTINYIETQTTPELTDEFVAANWKDSEGWATAEEAREAIKSELREAAVANYMWREVQTQSQVQEVPESLTRYHTENMRHYYQLLAQQYSMTVEDFLDEYMGVENLDALEEQNKSQIEENAKSSLILQALCEELKLEPSDEDIAGYFRENANVEDMTSLETQYGKPYLSLLVREYMAKLRLAEGK